MLIVVAPATAQLKVLGWPGKTAAAATDPDAFVAVSRYEVVATGVTWVELPVTRPTPELILTLVAPVTDQLNVLDWPSAILAGEVERLPMTGGAPAATVTDAVLVPAEFVALKV